jgi:hypothetical protein
MRQVGRRESDAILGAMRQVTLAGGRAITDADTASIVAAGRYLLRRPDLADLGTLPAVEPVDLVAVLKNRELAAEAVKYLAIMVMVDGALDSDKLGRVLAYARGDNPDPAEWILPYKGCKADPKLAARYDALGKLAGNSFGKALWNFDKQNGYAFPGEPTALNATFATPHDSTHVISGYDTTYRGEILVAPDQSDGGPHPAGDLQRPSRRQVQRRRHTGAWRLRPRRVLARLGSRPRHDHRHLRARLERLGLGRQGPGRGTAYLPRLAGGYSALAAIRSTLFLRS